MKVESKKLILAERPMHKIEHINFMCKNQLTNIFR